MSDCIFCRIAAKEIPSSVVYEDEQVLAFLDIKPVNPGHVLVVPKKHFADMLEADVGTLEACIRAVQKIGRAQTVGLNVPGFNVGLNNGAAAGQLVPHLHFHVMPRQVGDGHKLWHGTEYPDDTARDSVAEQIRQALK